MRQTLQTLLRRSFLSLNLLLCGATMSFAIDAGPPPAEPAAPTVTPDQLTAKVFKNADGKELPYRIWVPKDYDAKKKYPLVLFLHGAGERGSDNKAQLKHAGALRLATDAKAPPTIFIAPQCPTGDKWGAAPWGDKTPHKTSPEPTAAMKLVIGILESVEKEYSIDPDRRYVTGLSMGGYGTFDLAARMPDYWAAAIPICGGADDSAAERMAKVPMWIFHGDKDTAVPVVRSQSAMAAIKKAGGIVKYTQYPGVGHDSWTPAYKDPDIVKWLHSQVRGKMPGLQKSDD